MYADHPRKFEQLATGLAGVLHRGTEKYAKPTKVGPSLLLAPLAEIGDRTLVIIWTLGCCANALKILHGIKNSKDSTERHSQAKVSALGQNAPQNQREHQRFGKCSAYGKWPSCNKFSELGSGSRTGFRILDEFDVLGCKVPCCTTA